MFTLASIIQSASVLFFAHHNAVNGSNEEGECRHCGYCYMLFIVYLHIFCFIHTFSVFRVRRAISFRAVHFQQLLRKVSVVVFTPTGC